PVTWDRNVDVLEIVFAGTADDQEFFRHPEKIPQVPPRFNGRGILSATYVDFPFRPVHASLGRRDSRSRCTIVPSPKRWSYRGWRHQRRAPISVLPWSRRRLPTFADRSSCLFRGASRACGRVLPTD